MPPKYYAVQRGRSTGVYTSWDECRSQVDGYSAARHKSFASLAEAQAFASGGSSSTSASTSKPLNRVHVYTDGACVNNGKASARAGYGVYFSDNDPRNIAMPLSGDVHTNNRAELTAVIEAIRRTPGDVTVHTDSTYVHNGATKWMDTWKSRDWRLTGSTKPPCNQDLWMELDGLLTTRKDEIELNWVKGHADSTGNQAADRLACEGARKASEE
eukprot:jgi/Hompol1/5282/HPOL_004305-RA